MDDVNFDRLLEQLIVSTRSPRGRFTAQNTWPLLKQRLETARKVRRLRWLRPAGIAAGILLCLAAGWMTWEALKPPTLLTVSTLAEVRTIRLPDHTEVTLNRYSSLTYPERFNDDTREVKLRGEAYFEVTKDARRPFTVQAEEVCIKVLGTHFNVDAYNPETEIKTTLLEGRVAVSIGEAGKQLILAPSESAVYRKLTGSLAKETTPDAAEEILWRKGILHFDQAPLQEIARQLSNAFHHRIYVEDPHIRTYRLTATFRQGESLEEILELLKAAGNFEYTRHGEQINIRAKKNITD